MTIEGTLTGTLAEARELIDLARAGKLAPIPTHERPLAQAQAALDDLRAGRVVGRTVLTTTGTGRLQAFFLQLRLQRAHEIGQADLPLALEPLGREDRPHFGEGVVIVAVDDDVVVFRPMAHFAGGLGHAGADDGLAVLGAALAAGAPVRRPSAAG